jgi:cation transport protein ChaC
MSESLWVFAYGSLLWDPGFRPAEAVRARLDGYRRSFCMWSIHYRGTEESPGLVLALDAAEGVSCEGVALRPMEEEAEAVLAALRERELVSDAYEERRLLLRLADGREVEALAYVVRRAHRQYACVDAATQAEVIARARGQRGPNLDYLDRTAAQLAQLGIADPEIEALLAQARALAG